MSTARPTQAEVDAFVAAGLARLNRLFVGVEERDAKGRGSGHMPVWVMPTAEWEALGAPATASAWEATLA